MAQDSPGLRAGRRRWGGRHAGRGKCSWVREKVGAGGQRPLAMSGPIVYGHSRRTRGRITAMIIEPDELYYEDGRYVWSPERRDAVWDRCFQDFEAALRRPGVRRAVILIGIPGSGKSTWARAHDAADVVVFDGAFNDPDRRHRAVAIA